MEDTLSGKYEFFEKFKETIVARVIEKEKEIMETVPKTQDFIKKMVINIGYMQSYEAMNLARHIPTPRLSKITAFKNKQLEAEEELRNYLKKDFI